MDEKDVLKAMRYIEMFVPYPDIKEPKDIFESHSYSRWAANELLERMINETMKIPFISEEESLSAIEVISDFIDDMELCLETAPDSDSRRIFDIAKSEGEHILQYVTRKGEIQ